ncbi:hypothetical protein NDU88_004961 [Pleurodeles waltl]|uniref:Secreted protein n=1 Tax=Pleurodeles waltl TaxID=8319 RepID=A0AAV7SKC9_PLEWA|nr:hypothetical protein NDU88_004961 [Pleurodeles waltl]
MRVKFLATSFHWLLLCPGFLCVGPPHSTSGGPSPAEAQRRDVRIEQLLVPLPLSVRSCAILGHAPAAPVSGRARGERAFSAPHARSGLTSSALFITSAAGGRQLLSSVKRGRPPASQSTRAPGSFDRPRVRRSFWFLIASS